MAPRGPLSRGKGWLEKKGVDQRICFTSFLAAVITALSCLGTVFLIKGQLATAFDELLILLALTMLVPALVIALAAYIALIILRLG
ncbi:hypothetical protein [Allohahella sp. A8]|uniref:hypothetical protein n=1 Tax=Allohahella sp. A8 TaxID=3141461 RepID=UPI000C0B52CB|nr:hypothetical protein [Hahellaceae bacterium]|tara:strand:- start:7836 stop:8093 length:258 start_codon:yes stop_codon:yes gene_type:complete